MLAGYTFDLRARIVAEIYQETQLHLCRTEVVVELCAMFRKKLFHRLQFKYDAVVANNVGAISLAKPLALICYRYLGLRLVRNAARRKLKFERLLIHAFKESCAQRLIDLINRTLDSINLISKYQIIQIRLPLREAPSNFFVYFVYFVVLKFCASALNHPCTSSVSEPI